jgi:hypothetical protein
LFFIYTILVYIFGAFVQESCMQKQAIRNNAAHWATGTNGAAVFTWGK